MKDRQARHYRAQFRKTTPYLASSEQYDLKIYLGIIQSDCCPRLAKYLLSLSDETGSSFQSSHLLLYLSYLVIPHPLTL
ncbi:hypothetical protein HZ326_0824 [Fusarium oxysporum f. sp. albedinis]|nr:hypothetical protein HZ326_0824 [Fusarium oxysporum f. sp. albedinis]